MFYARFQAKLIYRAGSIWSHLINVFGINILRLRGASVGRRVFIGRGFKINWPSQLMIGNNVQIGAGVNIVIDGIWAPCRGIEILDWVEIGDGVKLKKKSSNHVVIGEGSFIGDDVNISCATDLSIGAGCLVAAGVKISDANHYYGRGLKTRKHSTINGAITIKECAWIGLNACILKDVVISEYSVVGAGSVVNKSVPAWEIWGGVPARFIKRID